MRNHGKMISAASLPLALFAIVATCPVAVAQEANQAKTKTKTTAPTKPAGATSSSYAACAPGNPIGGIIVKGGQNPKGPKGKAVDACPGAAANSNREHIAHQEIAPVQPEAAAREGTRTYTGGRRTEDAPAADAALAPGQPIKGVIVKGGGPNKPAQAGIVPPTETAKSISEKGVSSTKSR